MASKIEANVSKYQMNVTEAKYKEDRKWSERKSKKSLREPTYQSFKDEDISNQALEEERDNRYDVKAMIEEKNKRNASMATGYNGSSPTSSTEKDEGPAVTQGCVTGSDKDVDGSLKYHPSSFIEIDHRVSLKKVETAVIETNSIADANVILSCDMTDIGPEIRKKMVLETDIDTVSADDTGDYKVVGNGFHSTANLNSNFDAKGFVKDTQFNTSEARMQNSVLTSKVNSEGEVRDIRKKSKTLDVITENGEAENVNQNSIKTDTSTTKAVGLKIDQYKISQKSKDMVTEKLEVTSSSQDETELKMRDNHDDDEDVTLREIKGRDISRARRELKLNLPSNNNNRDKTAILDQLLLR